jgi:PKD repeat protein
MTKMIEIVGRRILILAIASFLAFNIHAQGWKAKTKTTYLQQLSVDLDKIYEDYRQSVETYALERDMLLREVTNNGRTLSLIRIMPSGVPEFYLTHNLLAAQNVGVNRLRPGADLSLNLTGKAVTVGVWDSGSTNVEHQEFGDRVEIKDNIPFDDHGTHVAGTIAAAGINPQAQGMAYETQIFAYEFNNDNAEMAAEAANGLIISNHSYGLRTGWDLNASGTGWQWFGDPSVSNIEDYRFGYYDDTNSRVWDDIAFNAPYYLIVKSAGNDRTDVGDGTRPPDGPYDCLEPKSVAKNILTIGAVEHLDNGYAGPEDVVMSAFSSWGPTDDGRIKPDISAIGVDVFSTLSGGVSAYGFLSGTSMSAPNTTGGLALLQEYYGQLYYGRQMLSATLKALAIHTAREAGANPGPDYEYGWGLLAVDRAANLITSNDNESFIINELNLAANDSVVIRVNSDGLQPLEATICWTDVPGDPAPISLNPTDLMLVNDLDLRIRDENGNTFQPWILDPANPEDQATQGDNFRDNVEKVVIAAPTAGEYTITIKHKNDLRNGNQDFSLIVSTKSIDLQPQTMYWIGGSGDWNDPANWSFSSGGNSANTVPSLDNPIVFDNNSFALATNEITLSSQASCYSINYFTNDSCAIDLASFALNVDGSLVDENSKLSLNNGRLRLRGMVSKNNRVVLGESAFAGIDLDLTSMNGSWNFANGFTTKTLTIENSSVFVRDKNIFVSEMTVNTGNENTIDFSGSTIFEINEIDMSNATTVIFEQSTIVFNNLNGVDAKILSGNSAAFHNVVLENATLTIEGDNSFNKLQVDGGLVLTGSNGFDSLSILAGSTVTISEQTTQSILSAFEAVGIEGSVITIQSDGSANADLFADDPNIRFCLDYLDVINISASGSTAFLSGDNSTINENSTGWIELDCRDALFPSFEVEYPCALGETRFIDTSTGLPTQWSWNFGNRQFPDENTSNEQNPFHSFKFEGEYTVTFNVKNSQFDETISRAINIINYESGLGVPSININGTRLTSSVIAPSYQWYLNNNPIPGANDRIYEIASGGTYHVTIADDNCLFRSEATVVTSLQDRLDGGQIAVYPNPTSGAFNLKISHSETGTVHMSVFDLVGKELKSRTFQKENILFDEEINLAGLPNGMYNLMVQINGARFVEKILIGQR